MILFRLPFGDNFFEIDENSGSDTVGFTTFDGNETVKFQGEIQIISQEKILENSFFSNEIKRFSPKDFEEINQIVNYDYFIVNEDIEKSVSDVEAIICAEKNKVTRYKNNIIDKFKEEL